MQPVHRPDAPGAAALAAPALDCDQARAQVQALEALLQEEFEALKTRAPDSLDRLEALQAEKSALLESLQAASQAAAALPEPPAAWESVLAALRACRDAWRRNEHLVSRQLDVVRVALNSLQSADPGASVDLYNRMGRLSRRMGRPVYGEA